MTARAEPGRINAIVVLSDGQDTDSEMSLDSLIAKIGAPVARRQLTPRPSASSRSRTVKAPTPSALQRIAEATGGQWFDASDPAKIDLVFASVINNF